jgi:hypothetical protein
MGGIIPLLSFVFERQVPREVEALIAPLEIDAGTGTGTGAGSGAAVDSTNTEARA